jgi:MFS family permease
VQFFPVVVLGLLIGHIADRYDRRVVVGTCQVIKALAAAAFAIDTLGGFLSSDVMLAILFVSGTARAFETPTMHTLVPGIVPPELLPRAIAASSTASQTAIICGPAIGGLLYLFGASAVYLTCAALFVLASILVSFIQMQRTPPDKKPVTVEAVFAGFRYIRHNPVVLGAISLDLFAVLLGGVTALLPIYAKDVIEAGPWGSACFARRRRSGRWRSRSGSRIIRSSGALGMCCSSRSARSGPPPWHLRSRPRSWFPSWRSRSMAPAMP